MKVIGEVRCPGCGQWIDVLENGTLRLLENHNTIVELRMQTGERDEAGEPERDHQGDYELACPWSGTLREVRP